MGKANKYLILIVIIIPVFFVSHLNKKINNTTTTLYKNSNQQIVAVQKEIPKNSKETLKFYQVVISSEFIKPAFNMCILNQGQLVEGINIITK